MGGVISPLGEALVPAASRPTAEAGTPPRSPGTCRRTRSRTQCAAGSLVAVAVGVLVAAPWLDQRLVWCGWLGAAVALLCADRIRGWWGEMSAFLAAMVAVAIAFHWTPEALATALASDTNVGLAVAVPIAAWDAVRLAAPLWLVGRLGCRPHQAWLPAALAAVVAESVMPAVFPWKLGYGQVAWLPVVQSVDLLGPSCATFVYFAHAGLIAAIVEAAGIRGGARAGGTVGRRVSPRAGWLALTVCAANDAYGVAAIAGWQRAAAAAPSVRLAAVQADPGAPDGIDSLRGLTTRACVDSLPEAALVVWPECSGGCYADTLTSLADPDVVLDNSRPPLAGLRPWERPGQPLLFGGKLYTGHPEKPRAVHQAALLVDTAESIVGTYRKRHLMPFGEYVPGSDVFPDLARWFAMQEELTPGTEPTVLHPGAGMRVGVLLCYEDMLPEAARSLVDNTANVLVSLINGSAFPRGVTLSQHRMLAQLRAVENRRALVRCAATGETCVVSPVGRVVASLPLHDRGVLIADVPLLDASTPARRLGALFPMACGAGLVGVVAHRRRRPPTSRPVDILAKARLDRRGCGFRLWKEDFARSLREFPPRGLHQPCPAPA